MSDEYIGVARCIRHGEYEALPGPDQWCPRCAGAAAVLDAWHDYYQERG